MRAPNSFVCRCDDVVKAARMSVLGVAGVFALPRHAVRGGADCAARDRGKIAVAVNGQAESYGEIIYIYKSLVPTVGELQYLWGEAVSLDNSTIPFAPIDIAPCRHRV